MSFKDILGHERQIEILKKSILSGRTAHAFLFAGPEGVGKMLTALAFAKALNCSYFDGDSCGRCDDCSRIEAGTHINVFTIAPEEGLIRIGAVRELQNALRYRAERGTKVAIVEGADRLKTEAANALLKTLEEPPQGSVIVLVTSSPADLLPTVVSRCQRINFHVLSEEVLKRLVMDVGGVGPEEAAVVARLAGGTMKRVPAYLDREALARREERVARILSISGTDRAELVDLAGELSADGDLENTLDYLKICIRDLVCAAEGAGDTAVSGGSAGKFFSKGGPSLKRLINAFDEVERAERAMLPPRYANKRLTMENLLIRLSEELAPSGGF